MVEVVVEVLVVSAVRTLVVVVKAVVRAVRVTVWVAWGRISIVQGGEVNLLALLTVTVGVVLMQEHAVATTFDARPFSARSSLHVVVGFAVVVGLCAGAL
jgi:hypothetical protein